VKAASRLASRGHAATHVGKVRERNEDSWLIDEDLSLYVVADGMGGHAGGAEASAACVRVLRAELYRQLGRGRVDLASAPGRLTKAVEAANREVCRMGDEDPALTGCGTTVTALQFVGDVAWVVHVGDTRCYYHHNSELTLVTSDHTVAEQRVHAGFDRPEDVAGQDHVLVRAVGSDIEIQVDVLRIPSRSGDRFLLCSDGLTAHLSPREIREILDATHGRAAAEACVWTALERGGEDNVTVLVVEV
jgi:protein phosphatase